jgi:hypothetical protein
MISSSSHLLALYLCVVMLAVGSLPMFSARPVGCKEGSDCVKPWDEADYLEYVARYNPFNGTHAAVLYTDKEAKAMLETLASSNASQIAVDADLESRQDKQLSCYVALLGGLSCMYDTTAQVRAIVERLTVSFGY